MLKDGWKKKQQGKSIFLKTETDTKKFGENFAKTLVRGDIIALHGDLGTGKTTFAKGLIRFFTHCSEDFVQSPTFTYLNIYEGSIPVFHFDLYRLSGEEDFITMGFLDYLTTTEGICLIEWPIRINSILPNNVKQLYFEYTVDGGRKIELA